jgi:hypothetical protein
LACVVDGRDRDGQLLLNNLSEPNETHLGLSSGRPQGRGVSGKQAFDLYESLKHSQAARTGLLGELSDCDLFVEGIGPDKISDITTNIIRRQLIEYTQQQCQSNNIPLQASVPAGRLWNVSDRRWETTYARIPVVRDQKIILVPKASVRWTLAFAPRKYYQHFVLSYLQKEELESNTRGLVEVLQNRKRVVTKKDLATRFPFSKNFLAQFTAEHPEVLADYKANLGLPPEISNEELEEGFNAREFARLLREKIMEIPSGNDAAQAFNTLVLGIFEFLFYPHLIYPKCEFPIHNGRKRIDIKFTNSAREGFFFDMKLRRNVAAHIVIVECKNYSHEVANPELDQVGGRFSTNRGRLGFLVARKFDDRLRFLERCKDTVHDDRGFIIPLADDDLVILLKCVETNEREEIDRFLNARFEEIVT